MKHGFKRLMVYVVGLSLGLSGCVITESGGLKGEGLQIGPQLSSFFKSKKLTTVDPDKPKIEVIVPVFDPGLSAAGEAYKMDSAASEVGYEEAVTDHPNKKENVWPELRRAEANRFAWKLKEALEKTSAFGAVRVTPDANATGDLYVIGKIVKSNGEDVEIKVDVVDISGRNWYTGVFDHEVEPGFHQNIRNKGKDPYDPVFKEAADRIAVELEDRAGEELANLQKIAELRFGANLNEAAFIDHLLMKRERFALNSYPAENDPMLSRTRAIRVRDQLFVDGLQERYRDFKDRMDTSYLIWQKQSLVEIKAGREANWDAAGEAVIGVLAVGLGVALVAAGAQPNSSSIGNTAAVTGGIIVGAAGASLISDSFQTSKEAKVHRDALKELGESIDIDMAPQVVAYEAKTVELTGTAKEQFAQWREFLKKIHEAERTPAALL